MIVTAIEIYHAYNTAETENAQEDISTSDSKSYSVVVDCEIQGPGHKQ